MAALSGRSVPRADGPAKVTGTALYVDDVTRDGSLLGVTFRSSCDHGRLVAIRRDPAFDWSRVTVVTASDVPVNEVVTIERDQPVLVPEGGVIRHRYEPIALVAGEERGVVDLALHALSVEVEPLPAVLSAAEALEANVVRRYLISKGDAAAFLGSCDVVVSGSYSTGLQEQLYIEPQGVLAWWEDGVARVLGSIQCPYYVQKGVRHALSLPEGAVEVTQAATGAGFGGKEEYPTILALHALLLSRKAGRPVKMVYSRKEDIEATTKRHPSEVEITSGCDRDGTFRALSMRILMDAGAYVTLTPVVLSRGALHAAGAYLWPAARIEALAALTNTPPNGAFRGFGAPQTLWALERHVDRVARTLGMDPFDLRRKNLLKIGDVLPTGQVLKESVGVRECIERVAAASGYVEKRRRGPVVTGRTARGIGASVVLHGAGFTGSGEKVLAGKAAVDLLPGGRLLVRAASTEIGQGTETVFRQIAADAAGLSLADVDVAVPSTGAVPDSGPTVASRTVMVVGSIVEEAARRVAGRVEVERAASGGSFAAAAGRLLARDGVVSETVGYEPPPGGVWDDATYRGDAYPVYGWGCDVAEVEVDLDTFETRVTAFWAAADVGKAVNPVMCRGQIEGGTLQAIGWALSEEIVRRGGEILNPRMTNYIVPTALDAPPFETSLVEAPYSQGPAGGAKGLGELPMDGGAPAIASAVEHATGIVLDSLPLTPERLLEASLASGS